MVASGSSVASSGSTSGGSVGIPASLFQPYSSSGGALLAQLNGEASDNVGGDSRDQCTLLVDVCSSQNESNQLYIQQIKRSGR